MEAAYTMMRCRYSWRLEEESQLAKTLSWYVCLQVLVSWFVRVLLEAIKFARIDHVEIIALLTLSDHPIPLSIDY
jgi:hypothetical protein